MTRATASTDYARQNRGALLVLLALAVALLALWPSPAEAQSTFTVNVTGDASDRKINGVCDSSSKRGKQCTLRAAIQEANGTPGPDTIKFNIGGTASVKTISPTRTLPIIREAVTINGYSQPGTSLNTLDQGNNAVLKVQLNGANAGEGTDGLRIEASDSTIRGLVINRFDGSEVEIQGSGATGNKVLGNFIGTNANGTADLGNAFVGVDIVNASSNTIGGTASGARNIISGNFNGIFIRNSGATGNKVLGNFIGTNKPGSGDLGNRTGVNISGARNTTIGGTASGARNVISGNDSTGVSIFGSGTTGNKVLGNFIGTRADGSGALGNDFGVSLTFDAEGNTVGGTASGARNVISGNDSTGVTITSGSGTTGNKVEGNFIGTRADGSGALGNGREGVFIFNALNNTIGGTASGAGNRIAHNANDGVGIDNAGATGNRVLSNSIFSNGGLGIDLLGGTEDANGVTANDDDDPDTGPNNLQNFPVITSAIRSINTGFTTISGTLNSNPNRSFIVQCFVAAPDPSGHGEGQVPVGQNTTVTTNADGDASFSCVSPVPQPGQAVTATATAQRQFVGDTSEFSRNVGVVIGP